MTEPAELVEQQGVGIPDALQRLWTPHRMAYIKGENKPEGNASDGCPFCKVVELDDKTHSRAKDELRDARLEQAGIRTVRVQARDKPKVEAIRTMILGPTVTEAGKTPTENASQGTVSDGATPFTKHSPAERRISS